MVVAMELDPVVSSVAGERGCCPSRWIWLRWGDEELAAAVAAAPASPAVGREVAPFAMARHWGVGWVPAGRFRGGAVRARRAPAGGRGRKGVPARGAGGAEPRFGRGGARPGRGGWGPWVAAVAAPPTPPAVLVWPRGWVGWCTLPRARGCRAVEASNGRGQCGARGRTPSRWEGQARVVVEHAFSGSRGRGAAPCGSRGCNGTWFCCPWGRRVWGRAELSRRRVPTLPGGAGAVPAPLPQASVSLKRGRWGGGDVCDSLLAWAAEGG